MCRPDSDYWKHVLICEWSAADDSFCCGEPLRAWQRDTDGLMELPIGEYEQQKKEKSRGPMYPYILVDFHIFADRSHVVIGDHQASRAGSGCRYVVEGKGTVAKLAFDATGGAWIS